MMQAVSNVTVKRWFSEERFRAWVRTLKTGDVVLVCDWSSGRAIVKTSVKITPKGRVYLPHYNGSSRTNWGASSSIYSAGAGRRFIAPLPEASS